MIKKKPLKTSGNSKQKFNWINQTLDDSYNFSLSNSNKTAASYYCINIKEFLDINKHHKIWMIVFKAFMSKSKCNAFFSLLFPALFFIQRVLQSYWMFIWHIVCVCVLCTLYVVYSIFEEKKKETKIPRTINDLYLK